jgi:hypothetical protein
MADAARRWYRVRLRTLVVWILLVTIGLSVYSYWSDYSERSLRRERELLSPARGAACTVVLRNAPGRFSSSSLEGHFVLMNDQWIVLDGLEDEKPQQWIPRENVLLLEVAAP